MAIIYSYPKVTSPLATDVLVLTDTTLTAGKRKNKTKSLSMSDLAAYVVSSTSGITGSGTLNTIPLFTPSGVKLGDSIITQAASGQGVTVTGQLDVTQDFNVTGDAILATAEVTGSTQLNGTLTVEEVATFNDEVECNNNVTVQGIFAADGNSVFSGSLTIDEQLIDGTGGSGTAGQVLSSTGTGVEWISDAGGSVTSVGLTMPAAFSVAGSPITSSGTLAVTGAGLASQVILGDGTLGSIPGGPFLPLAGGTMTGNTLHGDNVKSIYGTGSDLEIFHDGSNSYIQETAAAVGTLNIIAKQAVAIKTTSTTNLLSGGAGSDTELSDTNGVTRLALTTSNTIFPAGNVGIGTTNPADKLQVQGAIRAVVPAASGFAFVAINSSGSSASGIRFDNSNGGLILKNSSNVETIKIRSGLGNTFFDAGNVGIGTISPASKLHVNSGTANEVARFESTDGTAYLSIMDSNTTNSLQGIGSAGDELTFYSNNSERMRIDSTGNVGIGTTSPAYNLQVESSSNTAIQVQRTGAAAVLISGASTAGIVGTSNNFPLSLKTNNVTAATIITNGNFGINSANPASKLTVRFGDIEVDSFQGASGLILSSPDGTRYRVTVANGGTLSVAAV